MDLEDILVCRHESGHVSGALLIGHKVLKVARYGQHGILKGHGVSSFEYRDGTTLAEKLVPLIAGILWEPTHANGDVREVRNLRDSHPGAGAVIDEANAIALKMVRTPEFCSLALAAERALCSQPFLYEEDVEAAIA